MLTWDGHRSCCGVTGETMVMSLQRRLASWSGSEGRETSISHTVQKPRSASATEAIRANLEIIFIVLEPPQSHYKTLCHYETVTNVNRQ